MRSKFVVIFLGSLMILTGVLAWRAYELLKTEQKAALESQLRAQSTFASSGVESELQSVTRMMELADSEILRAGSSLPNTAVYQEFELIAKVSMPGAQGPDWKFEAKSFKEVSAIKDWAPTYLEVLFKKSSETDLRADSTLVFALPDPQKKPYLVVMQKIPQSSQSASSQVRVAILRSSWMQKLMDRSKGETATLRVINQLGQVVGHPTVEYVGSSLREDALVQNVMNSQVGTGSGIFETPEGPVLGQYEQVGASNLFVTLTVPTQVLYKNKKVILVQLLTIGVGISLLALAGFLWLVDNAKDLAATKVGFGANHMAPGAIGVASAPTTAVGAASAATNTFGAASAATNTIGAAGAANTTTTTNATATTAISLKEKMNIYTKVASGLSHELKAPVTAILGQTRVLRSELGSNHASIDKIEFEARHASELIQKLMAFSGEDKFKPTKSNVEALLQRALKSIEGKMLGKGVKLTKKIQSLPEIYLAPELFIKAVVSLLENAIEAMERAPKKELLVEASVVKGEIEITIQDSGEGISAVHLPKIFDPFFTTRTHQNHVGLGLATAQGIIKEMNGDIKIHSVEGQGVTAKIFLHPDEAISEVVVSTTPVATSVPTPAVAATAEVAPPVATTAAPVVKELKVPEMDSEKLLSELMDETLDVVAIKDELSGLYKENTGSKKIENDKIEIEVHVGETQDVLINDSIEKMMDDLDLEVAGAIAPALSGATDSATVEVSSGSMSVKNNDSLVVMDQPKQDMSPVKKESKLDQFLVKIRRPSFRQNASPNEGSGDGSDIGRANIEKDPS